MPSTGAVLVVLPHPVAAGIHLLYPIQLGQMRHPSSMVPVSSFLAKKVSADTRPTFP